MQVACLIWIMLSGKIILKLWKIQHHLHSKLPIAFETVQWMVTVFLTTLFTQDLLIQLLNFLLEINLVKKKKNCPNMYGNSKREILIILLIGILLWNRRNMFQDHESVIYAFLRSSLLPEQTLMFCSFVLVIMLVFFSR